LLVTSGLVLLLFKLGQPLRLPLTYVNFAPRSPLWWGGILQPLLVVGGFLYALLWIRADSPKVGRRVLGGALAALCVIVGAYHGLLLSAITARPLWNTGPTVVAAILSAIATGIAGVMLIHLIRLGVTGRLFDKEHVGVFLHDMRVVRNALMFTLVAQLGTFFLWWLSLYFGSLQDQQALEAASASCGPMFWWLGIGLGLVLPLGLGAAVAWLGKAAHGGLQVSVIGLTSAMILAGGFFLRLAVVLGGQASLPVSLF
jgi:formate-dependent nitrite reductase membrane component NrfD